MSFWATNRRKGPMDLIRKWLYLIGALWFVLNLPFQFDFPPTALGLMVFGLGWILRREWRSFFRGCLSNGPWLLVFALFCWIALGTTYTENSANGARELLLKIPMIGWPLVLVGMEKRLSTHRQTILKAFVWSMLLSSLLLLFLAIRDFVLTGESTVFFYKTLFRWEMVPIHYFALFLSFSAALSLDWMLRKHSEEKTGAALGWSLALLLFISMLALSAVRIQWIVLPVLLIMVWIAHLRSDRRLALPGILLLLFSVATFSFSPSVQKRLQESLVEWQAHNDKMDGFQTNERYYLWSHGTAMIAERPILGYGTGGGNDALNRSLFHEKASFWDGEEMRPLNERRYNFHSVYLQHLGNHGVPGLLMLLLTLLFPLFKYKRVIGLQGQLFLWACLLSFTTESMLQRQAGLFFFSFFYAWLIVHPVATDPSQEIVARRRSER
jgi:O-antigen ligase